MISAITHQPLDTRKSLLRPITIGGITIAFLQSVHQWIVVTVLSNPANLSQWSAAYNSAAWTNNDAPDVGSTYCVSATLLGSKKEGPVEIVQWDRPNLFGNRMMTRAFPIERLEQTIRLKPEGDGTQAAFESKFELVRGLKFAEDFLGKYGETQDRKNFEVAKRLLEAG